MLDTFSDGIVARTSASSAGDSILWIHGYTMDSSLWAPLWGALPSYMHYGIDLPGHGSNPPPKRTLGLRELSRQLAIKCKDMGIRHIVGLSFGSAVALQLAIELPHQFKTLTLAAPTVTGIPDNSQTRDVYLAMLRLYETSGPGDWMADYWLKNATDLFASAAKHESLFARLRSVVGKHQWTEFRNGFMRHLVACSQAEMLEEMSRVTSSVRVLIGEHDTAASRSAASVLTESILNCTIEIIPQSGHLCLLERPDVSATSITHHCCET